MILFPSLLRVYAVMSKEYSQLRRDTVVFGMILLLPLIQLLILGYAINNDPRHLPTSLLDQDNSSLSRSLAGSLERTDYLEIKYLPSSEEEMRRLLRQGKVVFALTIPPDFTRRLLKGERPQILAEADASDPTAIASALAALTQAPRLSLIRELRGGLAPDPLAPDPQILGGSVSGGGPGGRGRGELPFEIVVHRLHNPENITAYHVVPGLLGIILSVTLIMMTAMSVTRERERGTMESLLSTPAGAVEIMLGKLVPYILLGLLQTCVVLALSRLLFHVPMASSPKGWLALALGIVLFIVGNLSLGYLISTLARNQVHSMQMSFFYIYPNVLLSGFVFPFHGMPAWARVIGEALPVTHFMRIVRGVLLKNLFLEDMARSMCMLGLLSLAVIVLSILRSRATLD
ncbi:MAG: ABC transporter permease [Deltaproteobacteria bacterium]|jgi:ABC-2 type transport system permease protein|nr:ABC transporter permease [Deltaproteobacteria bacterium]